MAEELYAAIAATGLFDAGWYCAQNADVAAAGIDPLNHYVRFGRIEGRAPNAWFDPGFYAAAADLADPADGLLDYARQGEALGIPPHPDFDPLWYRHAFRVAAGELALAHFLAALQPGGAAMVAPSAALWPARFAAECAAAADPFAAWRARHPHPVGALAAEIAILAASGLFDANAYLLQGADVLAAGLDPLEHFCRFGWREGRRPNPYFDTGWYRATNADLRALGVNPLLHYLVCGEAAGRRPAVYFDPLWYRSRHRLAPGASALAHFLAHRRTADHSPHPLFDPAHYRAQLDPPPPGAVDLFAHYLVAGTLGDPSPSAGFDAVAWRKRRAGRRSRHFRHRLRPERDNALVDYLLSTYR